MSIANVSYPIPVPVIIKPSIPNLISQFIASQDINDSTKGTYQRSLKQFLLWMQENRVTEPTRDDILEYKQHLMQTLKPLTVSNYMVTVRKFFAWLEENGLYKNVAQSVKGAKRHRGFRKDVLQAEQIKSLLDSISHSDPIGKRDYAMVNLLVRTGMRTIEIVRADVEDLRQEGTKHVLYVQGKGHDVKDEFVVLTEAAYRPIMDYIECLNLVEGDPLFVSLSTRNLGQRLTTRTVSGIVKACFRSIGLDSSRLTAHSLRHTAVTGALLSGASIQQVQAMARHTSLSTTMIYAHNIDRIKEPAEESLDGWLK